MAQNVLAVYPGTFDPITLGHEDVVRRATQLFERVVVAVAAGHHKKTLFTLEERIEMVREAVKDYPQVQVEPFSGLLRDFVVSRGGKAMVRGLRAVTDFDYEFQLAGMNRSLMPQVETVMRRGEKSIPLSWFSISRARVVSRRLSRGSPMPMKTRLRIMGWSMRLSPSRIRATRTWLRISPAVMPRRPPR